MDSDYEYYLKISGYIEVDNKYAIHWTVEDPEEDGVVFLANGDIAGRMFIPSWMK